VNDIGGATTSGSPAIVTNLIAAYHQFINQAHAGSILAYGATITPFGGNRYYTIGREAARQAVNTWIRTNNLYDGVIDFDAAVRDPVTLTNLLSTYNSGDGLHLNQAGYQAMANAVNLKLFTQ
jgi:lysophospholipase L1-like esterase